MLAISLFIWSGGCEDKDKETDKAQNAVQDSLRTIRDEYRLHVIDSLVHEYDIRYNLDTLDFRFTIQFEDILYTKNHLIQYWRLIDVFRKDTTCYVRIHTDRYNIELTIPINTEQESVLMKSIDAHRTYEFRKNHLLVVGSVKLTSLNYSIETDIDGEGEDAYASFYLDRTGNFIGTAESLLFIPVKPTSE